MTTTQVVEMSVTNNSLPKDYPHLEDHAKQITDTPGFKPLTTLMTWMEHGLRTLLKTFPLSMEYNMVAGAFGHATNYVP